MPKGYCMKNKSSSWSTYSRINAVTKEQFFALITLTLTPNLRKITWLLRLFRDKKLAALPSPGKYFDFSIRTFQIITKHITLAEKFAPEAVKYPGKRDLKETMIKLT